MKKVFILIESIGMTGDRSEWVRGVLTDRTRARAWESAGRPHHHLSPPHHHLDGRVAAVQDPPPPEPDPWAIPGTRIVEEVNLDVIEEGKWDYFGKDPRSFTGFSHKAWTREQGEKWFLLSLVWRFLTMLIELGILTPTWGWESLSNTPSSMKEDYLRYMEGVWFGHWPLEGIRLS